MAGKKVQKVHVVRDVDRLSKQMDTLAVHTGGMSFVLYEGYPNRFAEFDKATAVKVAQVLGNCTVRKVPEREARYPHGSRDD